MKASQSKNTHVANLSQKHKDDFVQLPTHVCPECRYSVCVGKMCIACSRSKSLEKFTRQELERKLKAIPFDGIIIDDVKHINSQEAETYECEYVIDYIFEETITQLSKIGLLAKVVNRDLTQTNDCKTDQSQPSSLSQPIPGSITLDNLQSIINGVRYIDNFGRVSHKVIVELITYFEIAPIATFI